jgi:hypothetical protein
MESTSGMMLRMQLLQALPRHMRVNRGGGDVGVAEHFLHRTLIRAMVQQMCGKRMP